MRLYLLLAFLATLPGLCLAALRRQTQDDVVNAYNHMPKCGQTCILQAVPVSDCQTFTNTSCICTDPNLYQAVDLCVSTSCNGTDGLAVAKQYSDGCGLPRRNMRPQLLAPLCIELLGLIAVFLRLYSRWKYAVRYQTDDWIMLIATPMFIAFLIVGHYAGQIAFGVDIWEVRPADLSHGLKLFYVEEAFYIVLINLTKLSILFFLLRIFPQRGFRLGCYAVMLWVVLAGAVILLLAIAQCQPISYVWDGWRRRRGDAAHTCINVNTLAYTAAALGMAQDIAILLMPLPLVTRLDMDWRAKVEIVVILSFGTLVLITSTIRLAFIVAFANTANPTWDWAGCLIWSGLEVGVSFIVTSLPAIRNLLSHLLPRAFGYRAPTHPAKTTFPSSRRSTNVVVAARGSVALAPPPATTTTTTTADSPGHGAVGWAAAAAAADSRGSKMVLAEEEVSPAEPRRSRTSFRASRRTLKMLSLNLGNINDSDMELCPPRNPEDFF